MKTTSQAVETARQFTRMYVQVMRETSKRNANGQRIGQWKRDAAKVSKRLRRLMKW